jgi:hypothetical protein
MTALDEQNKAVREVVIMQIVLKLEREFCEPPAHTMAVRRCANTEAKAIAGDWWRSLADEAIRRWELG